MVDVTGETWSANTLSGTSQVVANDPYELRIAGLQGKDVQWQLVSATVSGKNAAAGVTVSPAEEPGLVRVTFHSSETRAVKWNLRFEPRKP
jgi:hypothetical protein